MSPPIRPVQGPGTQVGPFGWTGVRTEKYTKWKGKLESRGKVMARMIKNGVWHNVKSPIVIVLIVLAWVFSVLFTILSAGFGGLSLEADPGSATIFTNQVQDKNLGVDISQHQAIMNDSIAVFDLSGLSPTNETKFSIGGIPSGWGAIINQTEVADGVRASLMVVPPVDAQPFTTAMIDVEARTGERKDVYSTVTTIALLPIMTTERSGMTLKFTEPEVNGTAGDKVRVEFDVTNTGTVPDGYNLTLLTKPSGWRVKAYVGGSRVDLKTKTETIRQFPGPGGEFELKYKVFSVDILPGETARCAFEFDTTGSSLPTNIISLATMSKIDPFVSGTYSVAINLDDVEKTDLTGSIMFQAVIGMQVLWAMLLAAVIGSKMIATDMDEKSYNLYFSRPIKKGDYLLGKFGTLSIVLSLVTLVPSLFTYTTLILLSNLSDTYVLDHLWVWGSIIVQSLVMILTFGTLSLAFSSLTPRRFYAAAAFVVIFIATGIMSQVATFGFGLDFAPLISINDNFDIIGRALFDMLDGRELDFPWYYSVLVIVPMWIISTLAVWIKVERTELSE